MANLKTLCIYPGIHYSTFYYFRSKVSGTLYIFWIFYLIMYKNTGCKKEILQPSHSLVPVTCPGLGAHWRPQAKQEPGSSAWHPLSKRLPVPTWSFFCTKRKRLKLLLMLDWFIGPTEQLLRAHQTLKQGGGWFFLQCGC